MPLIRASATEANDAVTDVDPCRPCSVLEARRCGTDHGDTAGANLVHLEGALDDAIFAKAEGAIETEEAAPIADAGHGEGGSRPPLARDAQGQQDRVVAEGGDAVGRGAEAVLVAFGELAEAPFRHGRIE